MSLIILHEKSAHWYRVDKETHVISPFHEVPYADPKKAGQMRSTTIKDARKTPGAMVSVSTIMKVKAKPALDDWKIKQALMAAMTITRLPNEGDEAYVDRILADMDAESKIAREKGTAVHDVVERYLLSKANKVGSNIASSPDIAELAAPCLDAIDREVEEIYGVEAVVGNPALGYAGRLDLHGKMRGIGKAVVDFKTQKVKRDKKGVPKPTFYWEWGKQLAAYSACTGNPHDNALVSVIIDTTEPGPVFIHRWPDPVREWKMFCNLLEIWKDENEWSPMP